MSPAPLQSSCARPSSVAGLHEEKYGTQSQSELNIKRPEQNTRPSNLDHLVISICDTLGAERDLKSEDVDVSKLQTLMTEYESNQADWDKYAFIDLSRNYTRNLVDNLNGNANLILMTWTPAKTSQIHDHTDAHCVMRILQGHIIETKYEWPTPGVVEPLKIKEIKHYYAGDVAYINDNLGIHKVENADVNNIAVSLHLYTPPYIEKKGCNTFNPQTGTTHHVKLANYYSRQGFRVRRY